MLGHKQNDDVNFLDVLLWNNNIFVCCWGIKSVAAQGILYWEKSYLDNYNVVAVPLTIC